MSEKDLDGSPKRLPEAKRLPEWNPKREWWIHGPEFLVVVKHHLVKYDTERGGHNRWNVYAYVYPKHWHFPAFSGEALFQDAACALPLHSGPSFCRAHRDEKGITAYQVGSDYDHNLDEHFRDSTPEDHFPNGEVFRDAQELFNWLASPRNIPVPSPDKGRHPNNG